MEKISMDKSVFVINIWFIIIWFMKILYENMVYNYPDNCSLINAFRNHRLRNAFIKEQLSG